MATVDILEELEARSDGLDFARRLDRLQPGAVRIELGASSVGRAMVALPAIAAVARRFSNASLEICATEPARSLLSERFGWTVVERPELVVDLAPRAQPMASWDETRRALRVPACPYPWRVQHATASFADGATSAGFAASSEDVMLRLRKETRAAALELVRSRHGLQRPLIAILARHGGWGASRFAAVASVICDRIGAELLCTDTLAAPAPVRAAALALCAVCIGDAGGMAHVAAAVGAPIVTVHGRACPVRQGPASRSGAAVFARCRDAARHRPPRSRGERCLECLEPELVIDVAEKTAAEHWPRDRIRRLFS